MNLQTRIEPTLWDAVQSSYEGRNYKAAILDAVHYLTDLIRDRSGLEGDGVALVGAAFGGATPRLKVTRLQTESEQNVQRGVEALLRGIYQAIRNPRSHEQSSDSEQDCVAILQFVDYLVRIVGQAQSPFSTQACVARILDQDFVPKPRYAQILIQRIPERKRLSVCLEVFKRRSETDETRVPSFFTEVLKTLSDDDKNEFLRVVSDCLLETDRDDDVRFVLRILPPDLWPSVDEAARLRIEHKLIRYVEAGKAKGGRATSGALGTWITNLRSRLSLQADLWWIVSRKLQSSETESQDYVFEYLIPHATSITAEPPQHLIYAVERGLEAGDERFKKAVESWEDPFDESGGPWAMPFKDAMRSFQTKHEAGVGDDIPF